MKKKTKSRLLAKKKRKFLARKVDAGGVVDAGKARRQEGIFRVKALPLTRKKKVRRS